MHAQDFGDALKRCREPVSHYDLAKCMLTKQGFRVPQVSDATDLAGHLANIEAGQPWPFASDILPNFIVVVLACLRHYSTALAFHFECVGVLYSSVL